MELEVLCEQLLDVVERFDEEVLPFGLYASDEIQNAQGQRAQKLGQYQEWPRAIVPFMNGAGGKRLAVGGEDHLWHFDGLGGVQLNLVRIAKIKVRRYGSGYQVDKQEHRDRRWWEANLGSHLQMFGQQPQLARVEEPAPWSLIVLLIGFDKTPTPFGGALRELNDELRPDENGITTSTRCWMDKAKRGFGVRLSVWARTWEAEAAPPAS